MKVAEFEEIIIDYLSGNLTAEKQQDFEQFLIENPEFKEEFETTKSFWTVEEETPESTSAMDVKFYELLNAQEKKANKISVFKKIENFFIGSFPKQFAYTLAILTIGFFIGNVMSYEENQSKENLKFAQEETEIVRSELVLTLLEQPSANKRLKAVNEVNKMSTVTETVLRALFSTLNNDENVNVRL
jgi:hypothetical protein